MTDYEKEKVRDLIHGMDEEEKEIAREALREYDGEQHGR